MSGTNLDRLIEFAINEEKKAAETYLGLAKKVKDKGAGTMLQDMAEMEKTHEKKLSDFRVGKTQDLAPEKVQNLKIAEYTVDRILNEGSGIQDVILFAIQCEDKSHRMYSDISRIYGSGPKHELMAELAKEELKHKNDLERAYDDNVFREN